MRFGYDVEEELVRLENQAGEVHELTRDLAGRVRTEVGFDGRTTHVFRDGAGRVTRVLAPDARVTFLERDALGRLVTRKRQDGEDTFVYDALGHLAEAASDGTTVAFARDVLGRVIRERRTAGGVSRDVESRYDPSGQRIQRTTNMAHRVDYACDAAGALVSMQAGLPEDLLRPELRALGLPMVDQGDYAIAITRDRMGNEAARMLPGSVGATWQRDAGGRLVERTVFTTGAGGRSLGRKAYRYSGPEQLGVIVDVLQGETHYEHDARGHLVRALFADGNEQVRASDGVSNIYRDVSGRDRTYSRGGRLERDRRTGTTYRYDGVGNLVEKTLSDGARWAYRWNHAGCLIEVLRPDQKRVTFTYDAFGRRVEKAFDGAVTEYIWDGDELVHERTTNGDDISPVTTWLFEPGTFGVAAKLQGTKRYGVVADQVGAPTMLVSEAGQIAWEAQLDLYGIPREGDAASAEERIENPWRFPGQYEDVETGLFYNRFRYYEPEAGRYISQDPIGLAGGLALYGYVPDPCGGIDPLGLSCNEPNNKIPERFARVFEFEYGSGGRLGGPKATEVWLTAADDVANIKNSEELANKLMLVGKDGNLTKGPFMVVEFDGPVPALATPTRRGPDGGFVDYGRTAGGAREFVGPNSDFDSLNNPTFRYVE